MESSEIICKCGKYKVWVVLNEVTKDKCPNCGRMYIGKYNHINCTIEGEEIVDVGN